MSTKSASFFWPSYTDLMTSLFFIMLVLYVLTFLDLTNQRKVTEQQLQQITEISNAVTGLDKKYFAYDETYKRYSLNRNIEFEVGKSIIQERYIGYLTDVGRSISASIDNLKIKFQDQDIKYVLVIEGMASRDSYINNYPLSYERARAVVQLWEREGVMPDQEICEVQIAGSGTGGIGRFEPAEEFRNQRILIQIVPKIGKIEIGGQ